MKKIVIAFLGVIVAINVIYLIDHFAVTWARSVIFKSGTVLKSNITIRSGIIDQRSGSATSPATDYQFWTKELGGVDDYNDNLTIPPDTFTENFTQCTLANNYCGTNDATTCSGDVCYQDNRTNLVWSDWLDGGATHTWFWANNCYEPGSAENPVSCAADGADGCQCVRHTTATTSCLALGGGTWRLPHQKELMQVYIDGSWGKLPHVGYNYWSATTQSSNTHGAWVSSLYLGVANTYTKVTSASYRVRCVR